MSQENRTKSYAPSGDRTEPTYPKVGGLQTWHLANYFPVCCRVALELQSLFKLGSQRSSFLGGAHPFANV